MRTSKIEFENHAGQKLTARLELPADRKPANFALFAHCFTCNKNFTAVRNISRALTSSGFGVLRFDFTGLGESEGDFTDTNFSSNIQDIKAAANFLGREFMAPSLLIGHSLGGSAVLYAAADMDSVGAVATIGAPADPKHVKNLISSGIEDINQKGYAEVSIGGRPFTIKKQFIDDLETTNMSSILRKMKKALLIAHSPQDKIVGIDNAATIFKDARHPKSFVSLDGADHLLSKTEDSSYAGSIIATWAKRYISFGEKDKPETDLQVVASLEGIDKFTTQIKAGKHYLTGDEPENYGGNDFGPTPYDFVSAGLASCTAITIKMYADRKKWKIDEVNVHIEQSKIHAEDCAACEDSDTSKIDRFTRIIEVTGELDKSRKDKLLEIANKCPVHRTLLSDVIVETKLK